MIPLRRIGALLAAFALATATLTSATLPCDMDARGESGALDAELARGDRASPHAGHHDHARTHQSSEPAPDSPDESGAPAACPVMGPCALHLLGTPAVGTAPTPVPAASAVATLALAPPSRTLAPELPPPKA